MEKPKEQLLKVMDSLHYEDTPESRIMEELNWLLVRPSYRGLTVTSQDNEFTAIVTCTTIDPLLPTSFYAKSADKSVKITQRQVDEIVPLMETSIIMNRFFKEPGPSNRERPCFGGRLIGTSSAIYGTFGGCLVAQGKYVAISCSHVIAHKGVHQEISCICNR